MTVPRPALAAALALAAAVLPGRAAPAGSDAGPPPSAAGPAARRAEGTAGAPLTVLDGVLRAVDVAGHAVVVEVANGQVRLGIDRNTLVYAPAGLSTAAALRPGDRVRLGRNGRDVAYWIEVRQPPAATATPPSTPGQGTGPGGGSPAPPEGAAPVTPPGSTTAPR